MNMISGLKIANPETRPPLSRITKSTFYRGRNWIKYNHETRIGFGNVKSLPVAVAVQSVWELHNSVQLKVRLSRDQWWGSVEDRGRGRGIIILCLLWDTMRHRKVKRDLNLRFSDFKYLEKCIGMISWYVWSKKESPDTLDLGLRKPGFFLT